MKMSYLSIAAISTLSAALLLTGCGRNDGRTPGEKLDAGIAKTEAAASAVAADAKVAAAEVKQVGAEAAQTAAVAASQAAEATKDAAAVAAANVKDATVAAADKIDDAAITAKVKTGLAADPSVNAFKVDVDTKDNRVTLTGEAPSAAAAAQAGKIAGATEGVRSVDNRLTIKK